MNIRENVPIAELTTMRLGGAARYVAEVESDDDVREAYHFASEHDLPIFVLGGGSNIIGRDEGFRGLIILCRLRGMEMLDDTRIRARGGEIWDDLVEFSVQHGLSGIEAMSKIPGTVGAAPVQNIGAYGQDVSQTIENVRAYDRIKDEFVELPASQLDMSYRHSIFNSGEAVGRYFITDVTLKLHTEPLQPPFYTSLQAYFDERGVSEFSPRVIRDAVIAIRDSKLPDPDEEASSGSFFKNVYLDEAAAKEAEARGIPVWDGGKIPSGWLIENAGLKGKEFYGMQVSDKAALVLINRSAKSYADLAKARQAVIDAVREKFGYTLEQEPVELGE